MRWIAAFLLAVFTILMINDFFPNLLILIEVPKGAILGTIFIIFISISFFSNPEKEEERALKWNVAMSFYLPFLIVLLSLLGGHSETGISMSDPLVLVLMFISFLEVYKKLKQKSSSEREENQENRM